MDGKLFSEVDLARAYARGRDNERALQGYDWKGARPVWIGIGPGDPRGDRTAVAIRTQDGWDWPNGCADERWPSAAMGWSRDEA